MPPHQHHTIAKECCLFFLRLSYKPLCKVKTRDHFLLYRGIMPLKLNENDNFKQLLFCI